MKDRKGHAKKKMGAYQETGGVKRVGKTVPHHGMKKEEQQLVFSKFATTNSRNEKSPTSRRNNVSRRPLASPGSYRVNGPGYDPAQASELMDAYNESEMQLGQNAHRHSENNSEGYLIDAELIDPTERDLELKHVREQTIEEVKKNAAQAEKVVNAAEEQKKRRRVWMVLVCVTFLAVAVAVGVVVVFVVLDKDPALDRDAYIRDSVRQEFGVDEPPQGTPQDTSITWMIENDTLVEYPLETEEDTRRFRQRFAMCVFAFSTDVHGWRGQSNWLESVSECSWSGVTCDTSDQTLVGLNFANVGLNGTLPSELGVLTDLEVLSVFNNPNLRGRVPSEFGTMESLKKFQATSCQLTGTVPTQLDRLYELTEIALGDNKLTGTFPNVTLTSFRLQNLDLSENEIAGSIPNMVWHLQRLQALRLGRNKISGTIPTHLGSMYELHTIELHDNELEGSIPSDLGSLPNLRVLRVYGNNLDGEVPSSVCQLRNDDDPTVGLQALEADCGNETLCICCTECY